MSLMLLQYYFSSADFSSPVLAATSLLYFHKLYYDNILSITPKLT